MHIYPQKTGKYALMGKYAEGANKYVVNKYLSEKMLYIIAATR